MFYREDDRQGRSKEELSGKLTGGAVSDFGFRGRDRGIRFAEIRGFEANRRRIADKDILCLDPGRSNWMSWSSQRPVPIRGQ